MKSKIIAGIAVLVLAVGIVLALTTTHQTGASQPPDNQQPEARVTNVEVLKWRRDQIQARIYLSQLSLAKFISQYPHISQEPVNSDLKDPFREEIQGRMEQIRKAEKEVRQLEAEISAR